MDEQTTKRLEEIEENIRILETVLFKELLNREVPTKPEDKEAILKEWNEK